MHQIYRRKFIKDLDKNVQILQQKIESLSDECVLFKPRIKKHLAWLTLATLSSIPSRSYDRFTILYYKLLMQFHFLIYLTYIDTIHDVLNMISMEMRMNRQDRKKGVRSKNLTDDIIFLYKLTLENKKLVNKAFGWSITSILFYIIIVFVVYGYFCIISLTGRSNIMTSFQGLYILLGKM